MHEFSEASYNSASINQICKNQTLQGSFYQYFTDKLDLYVYIMTSIEENQVFLQSYSRVSHLNATRTDPFALLRV